eukprot:TRINITY_DN24775_c0_g1_i1.p1 TRINITY_DN24775_c0_g1~~TRINITY_DN24775_c0_g1_i1.p1  ORF type:complete len:647 (+),score=102.88 TRINITY_DN24775_c0_g1_i1:80-1942(+)
MARAEDPVADFATQWGLNWEAVDFLLTLDEGVRRTVMEEFMPRDGTLDISGKLLAFARSVSDRQTGLQESSLSSELDAFAQRWNLDDAARTWLQALQPEVVSVLVEQFDPKDDTQNIIGKMKGFARSIQQRQIGSGSIAHRVSDLAPLMAPRSALAAEKNLMDFASMWNLEESTVHFLRSLTTVVQLTVIQQFDPKDDTINVDARLRAFARSIAAGRQDLSIVEEFAAHWGLDDEMKDFLCSLPDETRATVIQQFDPAPGTYDIAGKLRMFVRGIVLNAKPAIRHASSVMDGPPPVKAAPSPNETQAITARIDDPEIADFVKQWNLDSGSVSLLESLDEDKRRTVMEAFDPRGNTRNVDGKLRAFATTVINGYGRFGQPRPAEEPFDDTASEVTDPAIAEFLQRWNLFGDETAHQVVKRLQPSVRERVMREFMPGEFTQNILGKLCGFAASVGRAAANESNSNARPPLVGWSSRSPPVSARGEFSGGNGFGGGGTSASHLPPLRAPGRVSAGQGRHGGGGSTPPWAARSGVASDGASDQFVAKWQLDEGCRAFLHSLGPDIRAAVMREFGPRDDTRDMSNKFRAFARSVASRFASQGQKRPAAGFEVPEPLRQALRQRRF